MTTTVARLVLIRPGALGDTLLLAPALRALREGLPEAEITVVGRMPAVKLLKHFGLAETVFDIERLNLFAPAETEYRLMYDKRVLAYLPLDAACCDALRTVAGVRTIAACPARRRREGQHVAVFLHQCLRESFPQTGELSRLPLTCPVSTPAGITGPYAVFFPGAGRKAKRAPIEVFASLARDMTSKGVTPVFLAGEVEIEQNLVADYPDGYPRIDSPVLEDLAGLLKGAAAVYANDSGPAHLAGLLGTPTTVFFGPTDPAVWRPWGTKVVIRRF